MASMVNRNTQRRGIKSALSDINLSALFACNKKEKTKMTEVVSVKKGRNKLQYSRHIDGFDKFLIGKKYTELQIESLIDFKL